MSNINLIKVTRFITVSKWVPIKGTGSLKGPLWRFGSLLIFLGPYFQCFWLHPCEEWVPIGSLSQSLGVHISFRVSGFTTEIWTCWLYSLFEMKHWKHLQDTLCTESKLSCFFLMWNFRSYSKFAMKLHVSQSKCELSNYIPFLIWGHHTGDTWKILWTRDLNFHACF